VDVLGPSREYREGYWRYGVGDLSAAGVVLRPEQLAELEQSQPHVVMVAWALPDPRDWTHSATIPTRRLDFGWRPTVPVLAEVDWLLAGELEFGYGEAWRRYPSVPIRIMLPDMSSEYVPEALVTFARLWDVVPIDEHHWAEVDDAFAGVWCSTDYSTVRDLYWVYNEVIIEDTGSSFWFADNCWFACRYRGPSEAHRHLDSNTTGGSPRCLDGEEEISRISTALLDTNHQVKPLNIPVMFTDPGAEWSWQDLCETSKPAAEQALLVAPPWQRDQLRTAERKAGRPWD
jgi:hypothetical protein